jgi:apolipoprotein N-acyltransferase
MKNSAWTSLLLAFVGGLLLFLSDQPVGLWPLQLVALVPLLLAARRVPGRGQAALVGVAFALGYGGPLTVLLAFPWWATALEVGYVAAVWALVAAGLWCVREWREPWRALASAAVVVVVGWLDVSVWPQWGSAQLFTRVWSAAPWAVQFAAFTGPLGLPFLVVGLQGLGLSLVVEPARRAGVAAAVMVLLVPAVLCSVLAGREAPRGSLRVAAVGFTSPSIDARNPADTEQLFATTIEPRLAEAVKAGARLVLFPELSVALKADERARVFERLGRLARAHGVLIGLGFGDLERDENRLVLVGPDGKVVDEYAKTHLIWGVEDWKTGSTGPVRLEFDGWRLGVMICQDDNFADLVRDHARAGVDLVLVPTWDWAEVAPYHRENSLLRPIEGRYGLVRAAKNGSSLIADARGRVLAERDHLTSGDGVVVADLPLYAGGSFYGTTGDWITGVCLVFLGVGGALRRIRRRAGRS